MKLFLVAICLFGVVAYSSAQIFGRGEPRGAYGHGQPPQPNADQQRRAQEMFGRCQRQELTTDADMTEFSQQRKPTTKTGKCLHACLMESSGLLVNGKLSVEKSVHFMSQMAPGNNELVRIVKEISEECAPLMDSDRCELAFKIMECTEEGIQKRQDEMRKFMPRRPPQQQ
ncbi:general odorant-binding protein 28a-like [Sitodiplosis mosellana]|uniref:general odorant-binding protein 28a-like n=1 Tax=Sitodiplosis mosellana TaxID=263140 RepID=UPI0024451D15|nr:general odorant-binding protein 28a-like [Sitodiplosis mosellana]